MEREMARQRHVRWIRESDEWPYMKEKAESWSGTIHTSTRECGQWLVEGSRAGGDGSARSSALASSSRGGLLDIAATAS